MSNVEVEYQSGHSEFNPIVLTWSLPGNGEWGPNCGQLYTFAHNDHYTSDEHWCGRYDCPNCYEKSWLPGEARAIVDRLVYGKKYWQLGFQKVIHVVVSPPGSVEKLTAINSPGEYSKLRKKAEKLLKKAGMSGGVMIYHGYRMPNDSHPLSESPHWHVLGYGWLEKTDKIYSDTGWVIKNLGVRKSVYETARYQLSHATLGIISDPPAEGILPKRQGMILTTVWFGILSYNKMKMEVKKGERLIYCHYCDDSFPETDFHRIEADRAELSMRKSGKLVDLKWWELYRPPESESLDCAFGRTYSSSDGRRLPITFNSSTFV